MSFWEKNLEVLKERDEELAKGIEPRGITGDDEYFIEKAKNGSDVLVWLKEGRKIYLNSTYCPENEAEKFAKGIPITKHALLVFMGIGNGVILKNILQKLDEDSIVFLYEPSFTLFRFVLNEFDLSELIRDKRVIFFVEEINREMLGGNLLGCLDDTNVGITVLKTHPKYHKLYEEQYLELESEVQDCRRLGFGDLATKTKAGKHMAKNVIANIPYFMQSKLSTDFIGKIPEDMPAIVVSGGPSLEKNYMLLKQAKGKALIIALDRTARFLLDNGIEPDIVCAADYIKPPVLFEDERLKKIPFVYIPEVNPMAFEKLKGTELIYARGRYKFYDFLLEWQGKAAPQMSMGGSVATLAFCFASYLGIKRIILVGQDLALRAGEMYAKGWNYENAKKVNNDLIRVPGNVEEWVETTGSLYNYLNWFKQVVALYGEEVEVINATEGGAKIDGTIIMPLQQAIEKYCIKMQDISDIFASVEPLFPEERCKELYELLRKKGKELKQRKKEFKEMSEFARRCQILTKRNDYGKEFKEKNRRLSKFGKIFDEDPLADLISKYMEGQYTVQAIDLYVTEEDEEKEMLRLYEKLEKTYGAIYENMDEMIEDYQNMLSVLETKYKSE